MSALGRVQFFANDRAQIGLQPLAALLPDRTNPQKHLGRLTGENAVAEAEVATGDIHDILDGIAWSLAVEAPASA